MAKDPPYRIKNMMPGMIMLWYGNEATIPSGWHRCDGTVGTPDLRGRFVFGAKPPFEEGITGGVETHVHNFTGDGHAHTLISGTRFISDHPEGAIEDETSTDPAVGTTDTGTNMPPYYTLHYIMKL